MPTTNAETRNSGRARILLVDAEGKARRTAAEALKAAGYDVATAGAWAGAVRSARRRRPDILVLGADTPDLRARLRSEEALRDAMVVVAADTGADAKGEAPGQYVGAEQYISKPVRTEELLGRVDLLLRLREARTALRESEERLELALAGSDSGVWDRRLDPDDPFRHDDYIYLSPGLKRLAGYADEELPNSVAAWQRLQHPEDLEQIRRRVRAHFEGRSDRYEADYRLHHKDGTWRWIHSRGKLLRDDQGRLVRWTGVDWDVTDRRRAEQERAALGRTAQAFVELQGGEDIWALICRQVRALVGEAVVAANKVEGDALRVQCVVGLEPRRRATVERILGGPLEGMDIPGVYEEARAELVTGRLAEVPGGLRDVFFGQAPPAACEQIARVMGLRGIYSIGLRRAGRLFGNITIFTLTDAPFSRGLLEAYAAQASVAVERALVEQASGDGGNVFMEAGRAARIASWQWDVRTNDVRCSPAVADIFGTDPDAPMTYEMGRSLVHPDDRAMWEAALRAAAEAAQPLRFDFRAVRPDGAVIWIHEEARATRGPDGEVLTVTGIAQDITEQRRAEEALRESERRNRLLLEHAGVGIGYFDLAGRVQQLNVKAAENMGGRPGQLVGRGAVELFGEEMGRTVLERIAAVAAGRETREFEDEINHPGGRRWFLSTHTPFADGRGGSVGVQIISHDITDRKRAEEALRRSEGLYEEAQRVAHLGHWELIPEIGTPTWSAEIFRIFGLDPERGEPSFAAHREYIHPEDWDILNGAVTRASTDGTRFDIAFRLFRPDGEMRWMRAIGSVTEDAEGRVARLFGTAQDVTDLKRAEADREQHARFQQSLLDAIPVPVFYKDADGRYLGCNEAFERFTGTERDALVGRTVYEVAPSELAATYERKDRELLASPGVQVYESQVQDAAGKVHDVVFHKATFRDAEGNLAGLIGAVLDVTEQKRLQEQWFQSQKMEAVGHLAAGVAHDFRNQLTVIKGFAEMLFRHGHVAEAGREHMVQIVEAADRSTRLTGELLAFSGQRVLQPEVVDVDELLGDLAKTLPRVIGEDIRLVVAPCLRKCRVRIDPGGFQQALINLALNARDAMPLGGELRIMTQCLPGQPGAGEGAAPEAAARQVVVSVSDTGVGMDEKTRQRIYEPFFTTKASGEGTGLGLSMVYGFVTQSGGTITCESRRGAGTTFQVGFPVAEQAAGQRAAAEQRPAPAGTGTILIVEDDPAVRRMIVESLREGGYTVLPTANADEALAAHDRHAGEIDLLLTDLVMPGMTGVELAERIRQAAPGIAVLCITGHAGKELVRRGLDEVTGHVLVKPFTQPELLQRVGRALAEG